MWGRGMVSKRWKFLGWLWMDARKKTFAPNGISDSRSSPSYASYHIYAHLQGHRYMSESKLFHQAADCSRFPSTSAATRELEAPISTRSKCLSITSSGPHSQRTSGIKRLRASNAWNTECLSLDAGQVELVSQVSEKHRSPPHTWTMW